MDKDEVKSRMGRFGVNPTAMLKRGCTSREAERGGNRDRSRDRVEEDDADMDGTTTAVVLASEGEVTTTVLISVVSKASRKKIVRE